MSYISAIHTANPSHQYQQAALLDILAPSLALSPAEKRLMRAIYRTSGIEQRHSVLTPDELQLAKESTAERMLRYEQEALDLALQAIPPNIDLQKITHLITVSCTGMYAPGLDIDLIKALQLAPTTKRTTVNFMGCYGSFNALRLAHDICRANQAAQVLVVSVELCTLHFQDKTDLDNLTGQAIFADGAAAVLVQSQKPQQAHLSVEDFYCRILPQTGDQMAWRVGNQGFDLVLSSYVPESIQLGIQHFVDQVKQQANFSNIDYYAIHPGGLKILQACEKALKIGADANHASYQVLKKYGNMSSSTILFVLKEIWQQLSQQDQQKNIFACSFGPGLTLESMLLKIHF